MKQSFIVNINIPGYLGEIAKDKLHLNFVNGINGKFHDLVAM